MSRILSNFSVTALGRSKTVHKDEGRFKEKRRFKSGSKGQSGTNTLLETRNELCIKNSNCHPEAGHLTAPHLCPNKTRLRAVSAGPQNPWRTIYKHPRKPGERRGTSKTYPPLEPKGKQCGGKGDKGNGGGIQTEKESCGWCLLRIFFFCLLARFSNPRK